MLWAAVAALGIDSALALAGPTAIGRITQAGAVTGWCAAVLSARLVQPVAARLREDAVTAALALPVDVDEAGGTSDLVPGSPVTWTGVPGGVRSAGRLRRGGAGGRRALVGLAALDWRFALAALLAVPLQAYALRWYLRTSQPH